MEEILGYIKNNKQNYIEELKEFLKIPSISTLTENKNDIARCAQFVSDNLKKIGLSRVEIIKTEGHPLVYGEWLGAPGKPTILIYGHYDVQPVDPVELWNSPPFEPTLKNGKIFARGATDDKGQVFMHFKSAEAYFKNEGSLPLNVKFIIEGEEEVGSESLNIFLKNNSDLLKCDAVLISDSSLYGPGIPTLTYGLRGIAYLEVEMIGPNRDLHSGSFGGAVANPINKMAQLISKLLDKDGKVTIPGFYDDVIKLTKKEKENFKTLKFSDKNFAKDLGVDELNGEKGFSTLERLWARPTFDCNGIIGGFTGKGAKTVIPSKVTAKISMRLVPDQDPNKIAKLFERHIKKIAPKSVKIKVTNLHGGYPSLTNIENPANIAASKAMAKAFGKKTVFMREGGSIPIVTEFSKKLKAPVVLMGLGLNTENLHSPNEHFDLNHFELGIISSAYFMKEFAETK
ncbi:MAG: peptidase M20 [Ignavibacteria bacterium RBG_16_34_14]|nr:MAG: peptidase M20 [Ignavibacteria bacterium RBG_16_34_14]